MTENLISINILFFPASQLSWPFLICDSRWSISIIHTNFVSLPNAFDISFLLWKISSPSYEYFDPCNSAESKTLQILLQCILQLQKCSPYSGARKSNISLPNAISCQGPQIHNLISSGTLISLLAPPLLPVFTVLLCRQRHHQHNLICPNITTLLVNWTKQIHNSCFSSSIVLSCVTLYHCHLHLFCSLFVCCVCLFLSFCCFVCLFIYVFICQPSILQSLPSSSCPPYD